MANNNLFGTPTWPNNLTNTNGFVGIPASGTGASNYGANHSAYMRFADGCWWDSYQFAGDENHNKMSLAFRPTTNIGSAGSSASSGGFGIATAIDVTEFRWEACIAPPNSDLEDLTRDAAEESQQKTSLWESPAGFFLAGSWNAEIGSQSFLQFPLIEGVSTPLDASMPHIRAVCRLEKPLHVPQGSTFYVKAHLDKFWKPRMNVIVRCSMRYTHRNPIDMG